MKVRNNYNECITNLACSIRKYFELDYKHNTLSYIDKLLTEKQPKNVVVILFDGMGSRIIDRVLDKEDFFIKNKMKEITTVFPATTTAATYTMLNGLNPVEHGYLGWHTYVEELDEVLISFFGVNKETQKLNEKYEHIRKKYFVNKTITDEINEEGKYYSKILYPFGEEKYNDLDHMLSLIEEECNKEGKKYIYAYDEAPDNKMHLLGPDSEEVKELIKERSKKVEELSKKLKDTIIFVIADHGHIVVDNIHLNDYKDLTDMLERTTSIEQRAVSFKIKEGLHKKFEKRFNELFGEYFKLYTKEEVINSKLFGDGEENPLFRSALGDFLAISESSNKTLLMDGDYELYSHHAGYTDDEIYIPLIVIDKSN